VLSHKSNFKLNEGQDILPGGEPLTGRAALFLHFDLHPIDFILRLISPKAPFHKDDRRNSQCLQT
jgi:hypothetical protein